MGRRGGGEARPHGARSPHRRVGANRRVRGSAGCRRRWRRQSAEATGQRGRERSGWLLQWPTLLTRRPCCTRWRLWLHAGSGGAHPEPRLENGGWGARGGWGAAPSSQQAAFDRWGGAPGCRGGWARRQSRSRPQGRADQGLEEGPRDWAGSLLEAGGGQAQMGWGGLWRSLMRRAGAGPMIHGRQVPVLRGAGEGAALWTRPGRLPAASAASSSSQ